MKLARRNNVGLRPVDAFDRLFDDMWRNPFGALRGASAFDSLKDNLLNDFSYINVARHPVRKTTSENGSLKIEFDVPGLTKDDLQLTYEDDVIEVSSVKKEEGETIKTSSHLSYRVWAPDLDVTTLHANCENGVLTVSGNPVKEVALPKKTIEIK